MTIAGDQCGVSGVGQCDQVIVTRVLAMNRRGTWWVGDKFSVLTKQADGGADGIKLDIAPELLTTQHRLQLSKKLWGDDEIEASGPRGKEKLRRDSRWRDQR